MSNNIIDENILDIFPDDFDEKVFPSPDDLILLADSDDLNKIKYGKYSAFKGAKGDKGDSGVKGDTGASIISSAFVSNDIVFTKDDTTTVILANAKIALKGEQGEQGIQGVPGPAGSGSGDMLKSTYDPTNINGSAFVRSNHTGKQTADTISDFATAVSNNSAVVANTAKISFDSTSSARLSAITDAAYKNSNTTKAQVGLGNVDNTSDVNKPVSTAQQTAIDSVDSGRYDLTTSGTGKTINWNNGRRQYMTMTGNCTITFSNPVAGRTYVLELTQDATGSRTITRPTTVKTPGGAGAVLSTTANAKDVVTLYYDGTNYLTHIAKAYA